MTITIDDFLKVDIRVGRVTAAEASRGLKKPSLIVTVDFGPEIGTRKASAQLTRHYQPDDLIGRQVAAVVNFPPRQIGKYMSEILVLSFPDAEGEPVLFAPDQRVPIGGRMF